MPCPEVMSFEQADKLMEQGQFVTREVWRDAGGTEPIRKFEGRYQYFNTDDMEWMNYTPNHLDRAATDWQLIAFEEPTNG